MFTPYSSTFSERNTAATEDSSNPEEEQPPPPTTADELPPAALALASRLFESARKGETEIFEQVLERSRRIGGICNEKGDSLVSLSAPGWFDFGILSFFLPFEFLSFSLFFLGVLEETKKGEFLFLGLGGEVLRLVRSMEILRSRRWNMSRGHEDLQRRDQGPDD